MTAGKLYGIGVGPGDSELLTLKAVRIIKESHIIAYPAAKEIGESMARTIAAPHIPKGKVEYPINIPMMTSPTSAESVYDKAAEDIAAYLDDGKQVAVLCEGDPFFYGSFMYLFARLHDRYPCEVVAGVSSLTAVAAIAGEPLAARNDSLIVLPAPLADEVLKTRLSDSDAVAIIKLGRHLPRIGRLFESLGLVENAHYVSHATLPQQSVVPLKEALAAEVQAPYFSMILWHKKGSAWLKP